MYTWDLQEAYLWDPPELESKLKFLDAQIATLNSEFEEQKEELNRLISEDALRSKELSDGKMEMARMRKADIE